MQKFTFLSLILIGLAIQTASAQGGTSCSEATVAQTGTNLSDNGAGDQWFVYTATMNGKVTVSSVGLTSVNTFVEIYDGCDEEAFSLSDDFSDEQSEVSFEVISGLSYYINWRNFYTSEEFEWELQETAVTQGEFCSYPLSSTAGYIVSNVPQNKYRWFEFTASRDGKVTVKATGANADDCHVAVYDDCSYTSSVNNDVSWNPSSVAFDAEEDETYIISWQNGSDDSELEWTIEESNWEAGERCIDPIDITVSDDNEVDHESATNKWYRYIALQDGEITISSVGLTTEDTYLEVYTGCSEERANYNDDYSDLQSEITLSVEAGNAYFIKWDKIFTPEAYTWSLKSDAIATDITEISENDLVVYPNPTSGIVNVDLTSFDSNSVQVSIVNVSGATVKSFEMNAGIVSSFDMSDLSVGVYHVVVKDSTTKKVVKLLKQ